MKNLFVSTIVVAIASIVGLAIGAIMEAFDSFNEFMVGNDTAITIHDVAMSVGIKGLVVAAIMFVVFVTVSMSTAKTHTTKTKVYRYMSVKELRMLMSGETVVGQLQSDVRSATDNQSNVCFLAEETKFKAIGEEHTYNAPQCYSFLGGIVSDEILVEFETSAAFTKGYGTYASPYGFGSETIYIDEFYVPEYSLKDFKIVRFGTPAYHLGFKWHKYSRLAIALRPLGMKLAKVGEWFEDIKRDREYKKLCKDAGINE